MTDAEVSKLRYTVSCECGAKHTGEADSYPEAWKAMDAWKQPHNWGTHPARSKPFDAYDWQEQIEVIGDRSRFDGLQPIPEAERPTPSRLRQLLGLEGE